MTNKELVNYCKGCLGLPYIYATYGEKLTISKLNWSYEYYPKYWTKERYEKAKKDYIGKKVQDCTGLIEGFLMGSSPTTFAKYNGNYDKSANGWFSSAKEKGEISTMPEIPGLCVHYDGHMGVYVGNGEVIEARGFDYGVVRTTLKERNWTSWFKIDGIEYETNNSDEENNIKVGDTVTIKKGAKYGGAANGINIPRKYIGTSQFTVTKVKENNGETEAILKELISWVPVKYLTICEANPIEYYQKYTGKSTSIVDALKAIGEESSFSNRSKIANANGIKVYIGSASQNNKLLELIKTGKLIRP
uniref:NlpC/P60 domain-containing protein n=1 Tax=Dulem virus 39 TaxID=3145757 RepID=A0AAU8B5C7_9CAUD